MEQIKLAEMTGSVKQIAWATDIITEPYKAMLRCAENDERIGGEYYNAKASIRRKAAALYKASYEENSHHMTKAAWVIDHKAAFSGVMEEAVRMALSELDDKKFDLHLYDFN